ncbi:hypothetical protein [Streptomyces botrytidirepellens]|uniref:hypothetical protein n=1 Tax=Streptomyces botrytidirepellens TaxID=2486417 RepID=UPI001FE26754|nr:hypothetical protein [Streptomyces botrytidirepellens]
MTRTPADSTVVSKNLDDASAHVSDEKSRTDFKASLLLAFDGAVLAGLASLIDKTLPLPVKLISAAAALMLTVSAALLLLAVRPNLGPAAPPSRAPSRTGRRWLRTPYGPPWGRTPVRW